MTQPIWFKPIDLAALKRLHVDTMDGHLGVEITDFGPDWLAGRMPVGPRTLQPMGIVHGGASAVLAETLGSVAASEVVNPDEFFCVGQEINANHLRSARDGHVHGVARPFHIGRTSQVWGIELRNDAGQMTCVARLTMAVRRKARAPEE